MQVKLEFVALIKVETERLGRGGEGIRLQADGLMSMLAQAENLYGCHTSARDYARSLLDL